MYILNKGLCIVFVNKGNCTASKAGSCHTSTKTSLLFTCSFYKRVQFYASYLVIIFKRVVRGIKKFAKTNKVIYF